MQGYVPLYKPRGGAQGTCASSAGSVTLLQGAFGEVGKADEKAIRNFAKQNAIPVIRFAKGDKREEIARPYLEAAAAEGGKGTVALGRGQWPCF